MPWFHFSQNNSGGSFDFDEGAGITHHVVIEAKDAWLANQRAQYAGLYFHGCESGRDCNCCGDRWYEASGEGDGSPLVYDQPASDYTGWGSGWMDEGKEIAVHHISGGIEWFGQKAEVSA